MIVLCGKSGSGKTTTQEELAKLGMERIVTYTTRPQRPGEIDGVTYHYISEAEFHSKKENGFFLETACYFPTSKTPWFYGTNEQNFKSNGVLILSPSGLKALTPKLFGEYLIQRWYLNCPEDILDHRLQNRGDLPSEITRRKQADKVDFENIYKYTDYVVNTHLFDNPEEIALTIFNKHQQLLGGNE